jgi:hypothetical protein
MSIILPVSIGESLDKLSILNIKLRHITDSQKDAIQHEYNLLHSQLSEHIKKHTFYYNKLIEINETIWNNKDSVHATHTDKEYTDMNNMRFCIKNKLNLLTNSDIKEQKENTQKKALFASNMGLGDVINQLGAIRYFSLIYDTLTIIVRPSYNANIQYLIGNEPNIDYITSDTLNNLCYESLQEFAKENNYTLLAAGEYLGPTAHHFDDVPYNFYYDLKIPTSIYKSYGYIPEYTEQQEYLNMILEHTPRIVFTHLNASNRSIQYNKPLDPDVFYCDPCNSHYNSGDKFYDLSLKFLNLPIVLYSKVIEAAEELYLIDSAFSCFAGLLNTSNAKHKYFFMIILQYINFLNKKEGIGYTIANDFLSDFTIYQSFQQHGFKLLEPIK